MESKTKMNNDPQQQGGEQEDDSSKILEHEAGCDILLKKEAVQLSSGDFESRKRLELLEGDEDDDDGDDENGDDNDEDALDDGLASAARTDVPSPMPGYSSQADGDDDEDDGGAYNTLLDYGDNELLSSGKDVTIVDTTGDALIRGTVCAKTEYNSINAKKMDELWEEIGHDVYGAMQRVDLDDVVVNYNQHNFDICGYADGRLMTVIQHPLFTVIAPFD